MSFWDGTRWVDEPERSKPTVEHRPRRHAKDWLATGIMAFALVAMVAPSISTSAASIQSGSGLVATWARSASVRTYSETSSRIGYSGRWSRADHAAHMGGHVRFSDQRRAKATLVFKGSGISWIGPVGPTRGKANVYIDGRLVKTVSTYAPSFKTARVIFKMEWSRVATHRITIVVLGTKGHPTVAIDALAVRTTRSLSTAKLSTPKGAASTPTPKPTSEQQGTPRMRLSEDIGPAGSTTTLTLSGFPAGTTGAIEFDGSSAGLPGYTTTSTGTAAVSIKVPTDAEPGAHEVGATAPDGIAVARTFEVTAPSAPDAAPTAAPTPTQAATPTPAPATPTSTPAATAAPTPAPTVAPTVAPTPAPTTAPSTYAAIFTGDATGATDVTSTLRSFLQTHNGQRVALAVNGRYKVSQLSFTASNLTVDFRGARIQGSLAGASGIFRVQSSTNIVLNDPAVSGTGYGWVSSSQNEHGIQVDGGSNVAINRPVIRNTRGDGIYTSYQAGKNLPPVGVVITNPDIERASRNGIAPVAGQVTIRGGHIRYTGLHAIDFEVNDASGAASIRGIVDGVDIRDHGDLPAIGLTSYAVAAGGYSTATKPSMLIQNLTGDLLRLTVRYTASVTVRNNVSDASTSADFPGSGTVSFSGNVRITRQ